MHVEVTLLDSYFSGLTENNHYNMVPFLDFILQLIARDSSNIPLFVPEIPDIISGICLRELIPTVFASGDTTWKVKTLHLFEKFQAVLDALEKDVDASDLVHLVCPFTLQLLEVRIQVPPYVTKYTNVTSLLE